MKPADRRALIRKPLPRIDARNTYAGKSWAGCYIRDPADRSLQRRIEGIEFISTLSAADEEDYRAFLDGLFMPRRSRSREGR